MIPGSAPTQRPSSPDASGQGSSPQAPTLEAIRYTRGSLALLDQLQLPHTFSYESIESCEQGFEAIKSMKVRGAPAIAIAAGLTLAVEALKRREAFATPVEAAVYLRERLSFLARSRPTAVNLFEAITRFRLRIDAILPRLGADRAGAAALVDDFILAAEALFAQDVADNKSIGKHGADAFQAQKSSGLKILTHCNTGSLATAAYGTALGVIRALNERHALAQAFATETRPYNQGARLTAFELVFERIPATLITDSMVAFLMATQGIDGVVVGADRVVANGDTANKVGTYQLAIVAKHHGVPFYVAAPSTSIDCTLAHGGHIPIEERPAHELTHVAGIRVAAEGIGVWNPSFDVTPAALIDGIITEAGVIRKDAQSGVFDVRGFLQGHGLLKEVR